MCTVRVDTAFDYVCTHVFCEKRACAKRLYFAVCTYTTFDCRAQYVRREIRSLTEKDRVAFFDAMEKLYRLPAAEGNQLYGDNYKVRTDNGPVFFVSEIGAFFIYFVGVSRFWFLFSSCSEETKALVGNT